MRGYVESFTPLRTKAPPLSSLVPWRNLADPILGLMTTKNEGWLCCFVLDNPDMGSLSLDAQDVLSERLADLWKLLPPGGAGWHHLRRREAPVLPLTPDASPLPALLEEEHLAALNAPGATWENTLYLSFACRPPREESGGKWSRALFQDQASGRGAYGVEDFARDSTQLLEALRTLYPEADRLTGDALTAYLHSCVSVHDHPLAAGEGLNLHVTTADSGFWPGTVPIIGDFATKQYVRSFVLNRGFPDGTAPAIFKGLNAVQAPFDVVTRLIPKLRLEAKKVTDKSQTNWLSMGRSWGAYRYEMRTGRRPDEVKNTFVIQQGDDADATRTDILLGKTQIGRLTMTFMVRGDTITLQPMADELAVGNRRLDALARVVRGAGCSVLDDPINQTENFVGTWPGEVYANIDSLEMTSDNFATLALAHTPWRGLTWNTHLNSRPLIYARTEGCMRVGVDTFVDDQGDFIMVGPKGAGKSTALGALNGAWLVVPQRRLYAFDVGGSNRCCILCAGGAYHDLGRLGLQIMADLDRDGAAPWIFDWLKRRVYASGVPKHPDVDLFLWETLAGPEGLQTKHEMPRTLTSYIELGQLSSTEIGKRVRGKGQERAIQLALLCPLILGALRPFARGGAYGHLTDAPVDGLHLGPVHGFELERLLSMKDAYSAVLEIIFFRLKGFRDGTPTRYIFDEAWHYLNTPVWIEILAEDMTFWRREQTSGGFATQSISQLEGSALTTFLLESAKSRFFLPNSQALDDRVREFYLGLGLGVEEIERNILLARPRGQMYWTLTNDRLGRPRRRLIDLSLGPIGQAVCGSNTPQDHALMDQILAEHGTVRFAQHWLRAKGLPDAADRLDALARQEVTAA